MSKLATPTGRTVWIYRHVSQLCAHTMKALEQMVIADHATANTSAYSEKQQIAMTLACTKPPLARASHIRIVIKENWHAKTFGKILGKRKILPLGNIRCGKNRASMRVKRTRRSNTNCRHIWLPHSLNRLYQTVKHTRFMSRSEEHTSELQSRGLIS